MEIKLRWLSMGRHLVMQMVSKVLRPNQWARLRVAGFIRQRREL